ncbi:MAG: hypothetical protein H0U67_00150 [Gemmatimonadetes bacterium]|nr:hypothetical protein [Gemmatimonadota bacterium]
MVGVFTLLALGSNLPFHRLLYDFVPGFGSFRGSSKFIYIASIFLAVLAAQGADSLLRQQELHRRARNAFSAVSLFLLIGAGIVWLAGSSPTGIWPRFLAVLAQSPDARLVPEALDDRAFVAETLNEAMIAVMIAALLLGGAALIFLLVKDTRRAVSVVVVLSAAELFFFARSQRPSFSLEEAQSPVLRALLPDLPSDARVLQLQTGIYDSLATLVAADGWGSDPMVLRRYAEFMKFSQGQPIDSTTQNIAFSLPSSPLYSLFRAHATIVSNQGAHQAVRLENPLPRVLIVPAHRVSERSDVLEGLAAPDFDPRQMVLLEEEPSPLPDLATTGTVRILKEDSDSLEIEATLSGNGLLLITDSYSDGWRARSVGPGPQAEYQILPGNYAFRAIPLAAGEHRLVVEYRAAGLLPGAVLSLLGLGSLLIALLKFRRKSSIVT